MDEIKTFLKEYTNELQQSPTAEENIHPKIVSNYCLGKEDVYNQVIDWALHHLENRKCPYQLAVTIAKNTAKVIDAGVSEHLLDNSASQEKVLNSHALYIQTLKKLSTECQSFSEKTDDEIDCSSLLPFATSAFEIKNKRRTMEDRHVIIHDLNSLLDIKDVPAHSYYAVFDGHCGVDAASYASAHLHVNLAKHPEFLTNTSDAISQSYKITDENFLKKCEDENLKSGCTALCALIRDKRIYLSWAGDAQAVLVKGGRPVLVTEPHKPDRPDERKRIEDLGGAVTHMGVWRVNGVLAITRALGDADYRPFVISEPEMATIDLDGTEDFLVLACDGLFDGMTPDEVTASLYQNLSESVDEPLDTLAAKLAHKAKEQGSEDNITTIVVFLRDVSAIRDYASELLAQGISQTNFLDMNGDEKHESPCKPTVLELNAASTKKLKNTANVLSSAGFQCLPVYSEGDFDGNMFQNSDDFVPRPNLPSYFAPEATALSELPTPPIDDVVASQQFGNICPVELFQGLNSISSEKCALVEEEANAFNSGDFESMVNVQQLPCDQVPSETLVDPLISSDFVSKANVQQPPCEQSIVNTLQDQSPSGMLIETSGNNDFTPDEAANVASCVVSNTIETAVRCLSSNELFEPGSPVSQLNPYAKPFIPGEMQLQSEPQDAVKAENTSEDVFSNLEGTHTIEREALENKSEEQVSEECSRETVADGSIKDTLAGSASKFENVLEFNEDNGSKTVRVSSLTSRFSALSILSPQLSGTGEEVFEQEISKDHNMEPSMLEIAINKTEIECATISPNSPMSVTEQDIISFGGATDSTNVVQETVNALNTCEVNLLESVSSMAENDQSITPNISKNTIEADTIALVDQIIIPNEADNIRVQDVQTINAQLVEDSLITTSLDYQTLKGGISEIPPESKILASESISNTFISTDNNASPNAVNVQEAGNSPSDVDIKTQNIQVADKLAEDSTVEIKSPAKITDAGFSLESVTFESLNLVGVGAEVTSTEEKLAEEGPVEAVDLQTVPVGVPEAEGVTEDVDSDSEKDGGWSYMKGNTLGKSKPEEPKPKADKSEVASKLKKDITKAASDNKSKVRSMTAIDKSKKPILDKKVLNVKEKVKPTRTVSSTLPKDVSKSMLSKDACKPSLTKSAADKLAKPSSTLARVKKEATATVPGTKAPTASSTLPKDASKPTLTKSTVDKTAKPPSTFARIKKEASATTKASTTAATLKPSRPTTLRNPLAASKPMAPSAKDRVISATVKTANATTVDSARPKSALATNGVKAPSRAPILPKAQPSLQSKVIGAASTRSTTLSRPASATVPTRALTKPSKPVESKVKPLVSTIKRIDPKKPDVKETKDIVNKQISARKNVTASTLTRSETTKSATTSNKRAMTLSNKPVPSLKMRSVPLKNEANKKDVPKSAGSKIAQNANNPLKSSKVDSAEKVPTIEGRVEKNLNELAATPIDPSSQVITPASEEEKFLLEVNDKEIQSVQENEKDEMDDQQPHCLENGLADESVKPLEDTLPVTNHVECSAQNV